MPTLNLNARMEVKNATAVPTTNISAHRSEQASSNTMSDALKSIYTIEEYAELPVDSPNTPLRPKAVSTRNSTKVIAFYEKLAAFGLPNPVLRHEGDGLNGWDVQMKFLEGELEQTIDDSGPYPSKKDARDAVVGRGLEILSQLEAEGKISKKGKGKQKAASETLQPEKEEEEPKEPGRNYVGLLLEFQRSNNADQPNYTMFSLGASWSCEMRLPGLSRIFGGMSSYFPGKKVARQNAAKEGIDYYKSINLWPKDIDEATGSIKKKKAVQPPPSSKPKKKASGPNTTSAVEASYASLVAEVARELHYPAPQYVFESADIQAPNFYTVKCFFKELNGSGSGPHGEVRHVYGKKNAKEACARLTWAYLNSIKMQRLQAVQRMLEMADADSEDGVEASGDEQFEDAMDVSKGDV
ncbi:hypothetical protein K469DRAFT_704031 [Zopfia rhizophila CBS 207.26]|uniref:DRBM domain-containing protein n=1 Tax=Zopfia rhizophila CBS 207.26 TaxID=1314779 RepID=A0A6A6D9N4_9PEZI|nr:hypothetical protein K469DRAFT_704031 [Zopfia rhizophila CBS 207.26]